MAPTVKSFTSFGFALLGFPVWSYPSLIGAMAGFF